MKPSLKTVSKIAVCALVWIAPLCAGQSDGKPSPETQPAATEPARGEAGAPSVTPVPAPVATPPAAPQTPQADSTPAPADNTKAVPSPPPTPKSSTEVKPEAEPLAAAPKPAGGTKVYVVGPLDVLYIRVWNQGQLSGTYDVRSDGMLSMPLIGEFKADGLTAAQLKDTIRTHLNDFLNNPEVDVQVAKVNSKRFFVYGGVGRPGEFPLIEKTTIMDALSVVGGFRDFAKPNKIMIQRGSQTFHFNYKDFIKNKNMDKNENIEILNGDRIYVPE